MSETGKFVQETIDLMNSGAYEAALLPAIKAIESTIAKEHNKDKVGDLDVQRFLREHWNLIVFMGLPRVSPLPLSIPFAIKRIVPSFDVHSGLFETIFFVLSKTRQFGSLPDEFKFNSSGELEVTDGKVLLPISLVLGLVGSVVFHPLNKDEEIGEQYWMSVGEFKMFVSELYGRQDLAERILRFYS